jgi:hypothetical protein
MSRPVNLHPGVAAQLADRDNWTGGYYGLALEFAEGDDSRLGGALERLWQAAGVRGCYATTGGDAMPKPVPLSLATARDHGQLRGVARLPTGHEVVCGLVVIRERDTVDVPFDAPDWLDFFVPLGALERLDDRIGGYPFGDFKGSLEWRRPLDDWLARVGKDVYPDFPFRLGLIGMEVSGEAYARSLEGQVPADRWFGYLMPTPEGLRYLAATS